MDIDGLDPRKLPPQRTYPPAKIYPIQVFPAFPEARIPIDRAGRKRARELQSPAAASSNNSTTPAIVIDNGSSAIRAGWSFSRDPHLSAPPITARFRDRKAGKTYTLVGDDCYADTSARNNIRTAFEAGTGVVSTWDAMENILDYVFVKLGLNDEGHNGRIDAPVVMTETVANLPYARKTMTELLFECYAAPSVAYGIDALFSYRQNQGSTGLVVSSGYSSTHVIPVYQQRPLLAQSIRMDWGGWHAAEYLLKLVRLKYPNFTGKLTSAQMEELIRDHGYVSLDYAADLETYLDWTGLEDRDHVIQFPFVDEVVVEKSQEELDRIAERKREGGRRLQEQAAKMRLERLIAKERQLDELLAVQQQLAAATTKKETKRLLDDHELRDEQQLERMIRDLEKSVRKARTKDVGGDGEGGEDEVPVFDLVDIPDEELDEAGVKAKKQQRLAKASYDARRRAKAEKEAEKQRLLEEKQQDEERRTHHLSAWLEDRRSARQDLLQRIREKERMTQDMGNRKSLASQIRMKSIAHLASDTPSSRKRRRGGAGGAGDDDGFGANDDDWGVYRDIATEPASDDEEEDLEGKLASLEQDLLRYDRDFTYEDTRAAKADWSRSLLHAFLRGPRPFDPDAPAEANQIHLNVERIRVPEVVFQPSLAGVDQAGLVQILSDILNQRLATLSLDDPRVSSSSSSSSTNGAFSLDAWPSTPFVRDIFLTGGFTQFPNFAQRLEADVRAHLPADAPTRIRQAQDPVGDAWRGAASWVGTDEWRAAQVTRSEYEEFGPEYMKEHNLGNTKF